MPPEDTAPAATEGQSFESTDDIVGALLDGTEPPEPEVAAAEDPPEATADDDAAPADDEPEAEDDDAAPVDGELPPALVEARKAAEEGDLDKAFLLAFGKKPEELQPNSKAWTKWRAANDRAQRGITADRQRLEGERQQFIASQNTSRAQLQQAIDQLRPYEQHFLAAQAFRRDGDPGHLVKLIELTTELSYDEAQKLILSKQRRTPGERKLAEQLAAIQRQLEETNAGKAKQEQELTAQQVYANDLQFIRGKVTGEVTKVPKFAERIYNVLLKTKGPVGLTLTPEQAAERVLASERRRLAKHPLLKQAPANPVSAAAATLARAKNKGKPPGPPLRRNSQNNGAKDPTAIESTDDIIGDLLKDKRRAS
jgi:hypothetical protein